MRFYNGWNGYSLNDLFDGTASSLCSKPCLKTKESCILFGLKKQISKSEKLTLEKQKTKKSIYEVQTGMGKSYYLDMKIAIRSCNCILCRGWVS